MSASPPLHALVLAGTRAGGDALAAHAGVSHKALIEVGGQTMVERVVGALAQVEAVQRILVAIEQPGVLAALPGLRAPLCPKPVETIEAAATPSASVAAVLERLGAPLLVTTADHALLAPQWVEAFLSACPREAHAALALARRESVVAASAGARRTYLRFADGEFCGCNLFYLQHAPALQAVRFWREIEAHRKAPLAMMLRLGAGVALRYRFGRLRLRDALERLEELCAARIRIVELDDGRAAIDVDKPADLALVRALAAGRDIPV